MTGSLARRYARALIGIAREENQVAAFQDCLNGLSKMLQENPAIQHGLADDSLPKSERLSAVEEIASKLGFHPLLKNFLLVVVSKERFANFCEIADEYQRMSDELLGIVRATVTLPSQTDGEVAKKMEEVLSGKLKKTVITKSEIDSEMLGGVILKMSHLVYDGSLRRELENLKQNMLKG